MTPHNRAVDKMSTRRQPRRDSRDEISGDPSPISFESAAGRLVSCPLGRLENPPNNRVAVPVACSVVGTQFLFFQKNGQRSRIGACPASGATFRGKRTVSES